MGVYKGNSASLLAKFARKINRTLYLFDTFEGFNADDTTGIDSGRLNSFTDTSLPYVKGVVGENDVNYVQGYFPQSLSMVGDAESLKFALVHIDCDLEKPFIAALNYFYPKLIQGGLLIMHDYASLCWPGATKAVNDFSSNKPESVIPIPDKSGTVVIRKV